MSGEKGVGSDPCIRGLGFGESFGAFGMSLMSGERGVGFYSWVRIFCSFWV